MGGMREFDSTQVAEIASAGKFTDQPSERVCPACGNRALRTYIYRVASGSRNVRITYTWCASCRRFKGWTGPDLGDLEFSDPFEGKSLDERQALEKDLGKFLRQLDELWDAGELPQKFHATRGH